MWKTIVENWLIKVAVNIQHSFNQWSKSRFIWNFFFSDFENSLEIGYIRLRWKGIFFFSLGRVCLGPENLSLLFGLKRLYPEYFQNLRQKKIPEKNLGCKLHWFQLVWMTNYIILYLNCVKMIVKNPYYC